MAQLNFDARQVSPQQNLEAIPDGWYHFNIVNSELKPTANGNGAYLELALKVLDGDYANRQVFDRLNIQNQNPVAVEIAYRRLSAYCHATGVYQLQDSQQLHGIPFKARVNVRRDPTGQYDPQNDVKAVDAIDTGTAQQSFAQPPAQAPTAPTQAAPAQAPYQQQAPTPQAPQAAPWASPPAQEPPPWAQQPPAQPQQQPPPAAQPNIPGGIKPPWENNK